MESSTGRTAEERREREDIMNEIARLQVKLKDLPPEANVTSTVSPPASPKRKRPVPKTLVPSTPSPSKICVVGSFLV